jgi:hypothetical protein
MASLRALGSQPQAWKRGTAGSTRSQQPLAGRPSKSQRVAARWFFEPHLAKASSGMSLAGSPGMSTSTPRLFLRTAEVTA